MVSSQTIVFHHSGGMTQLPGTCLNCGRWQRVEALRATTAAHCTADGVTYTSATWITTARR